nr:hypothetical protein [Mycoplasmopsis bovis]
MLNRSPSTVSRELKAQHCF